MCWWVLGKAAMGLQQQSRAAAAAAATAVAAAFACCLPHAMFSELLLAAKCAKKLMKLAVPRARYANTVTVQTNSSAQTLHMHTV
jgi:hypothetical protein